VSSRAVLRWPAPRSHHSMRSPGRRWVRSRHARP
jgi:hypothetical protein